MFMSESYQTNSCNILYSLLDHPLNRKIVCCVRVFVDAFLFHIKDIALLLFRALVYKRIFTKKEKMQNLIFYIIEV